jgi:hypothetical protein
MASSLLTPSESTTLLTLAYELQTDRQAQRYLDRVEKILLDKLFASNETERLLGLSKSS